MPGGSWLNSLLHAQQGIQATSLTQKIGNGFLAGFTLGFSLALLHKKEHLRCAAKAADSGS
jgi:uncharacterized membrane protein (Fun14 family)